MLNKGLAWRWVALAVLTVSLLNGWFLKLPQEADYVTKSVVLFEGKEAFEGQWKTPFQGADPDLRLRVSLVVEGHRLIEVQFADAKGSTSKKLRVYQGPQVESWVGVFPVHRLEPPLNLELSGSGILHRVVVEHLQLAYFVHRDLLRLSFVVGSVAWLALLFYNLRVAWGAKVCGRRFYYWILPLCLIVALGTGLAQRFDARDGFSKLICLGHIFERIATDRYLSLGLQTWSYSGYDGGQYAQVALDPLDQDRPNLAHALDNPHYRYRRIGLPLTAWAIGLGQSAWVWQVYALINVGFWLGLLWLLFRILDKASIRNAAAIGAVVLSAGAVESIRLALVDLPAVTAACFAIWWTHHRGIAGGAAWFGYACMIRETCLLMIVALMGRLHWTRDIRGLLRSWMPLAVVLLGLGLWFLYVRLNYENPTDAAGDNISTPFKGWLDRWNLVERMGGWGEPQNHYFLAALIGLGVQAAFLCKCWDWKNPWWRAGAVFIPLYVCLQIPVWENYFAVTRTLLPLTIAFNLLLVRERGWTFWAWWFAGNAFAWDGLYRWVFTGN